MRFCVIVALLLTLLAHCSHSPANADDWGTDFEIARKTAQSHDKDLLVYFTSSDGCAWCRVFERLVLDTPDLQKAHESFVFVKLNFPFDESLLNSKMIERSRTWKSRWGVTGFPTVVLSDTSGRPFGWFEGHQPDGAEAFYRRLIAARHAKDHRDQLFAEAEHATPSRKAKLLDRALSQLPLDSAELTRFYRVEIETVIADSSDAVICNEYRKRLVDNDEEAFQQEIESRIWERAGEYIDVTIAVAVLDEALRENGLSEARRRWLLGRKAIYRWTEGDFAEAAELVRKSIAEDDPRESPAKEIFHAQLLFKAGNRADALRRFDELATAYSALPDWRSKTFDRMAQVLQEAGQVENALSATERALRGDISLRQRFNVQWRRVDLLLSLGQADDAVAAARDALVAVRAAALPEIGTGLGLVYLAKALDGAGDKIGAMIAAESARKLLQKYDSAALENEEIAAALTKYPVIAPVEALPTN